MTRLRGLTIAAAVAASATVGSAAGAADNPFPSLAGTWNGAGTARLEGGKSESLRCKGYYKTEGATLGMSIRCANAGSKVELRASLRFADGNITGDWEERTYNQSGTVAGKATANRLALAISGGVNGTLTVSVSNAGHQFALATEASALKGLNISMTR